MQFKFKVQLALFPPPTNRYIYQIPLIDISAYQLLPQLTLLLGARDGGRRAVHFGRIEDSLRESCERQKARTRSGEERRQGTVGKARETSPLMTRTPRLKDLTSIAARFTISSFCRRRDKETALLPRLVDRQVDRSSSRYARAFDPGRFALRKLYEAGWKVKLSKAILFLSWIEKNLEIQSDSFNNDFPPFRGILVH